MGGYNINIILDCKYWLDNRLLKSCKIRSSDVRRYYEFCTIHGVKMLIKAPAWITGSPEHVSTYGVSDVGVSYHQLIFCIRKISRLTSRMHKQITIRLLKNYSTLVYKDVNNDKNSFPSTTKLLKW